jgi:hypothetical protein
VHNFALDTSQVNWVVKGADNSVVAVIAKINSVSWNGRRREQTPEEDNI